MMLLLIVFSSCEIKSANDYFIEANKCEDTGDYKGAILLLNKAIKIKPNLIKAYINRGADESMLGNFDLAIQNYSAALKISPRNNLALVSRGKNKGRLEIIEEQSRTFNRL